MKKNYKKAFLTFTSGLLILLMSFTPTVRALELAITDNGGGSDSEVNVQLDSVTQVTQSNQADVSNDVDVSGDTGENTASGNSGDTSIDTGDVNMQVGIENSVNSSSVDVGCCPESSSAEISGNGADSDNSITVEQSNTTNIEVNQSANVSNNIDGSANTGDNTANDNSGNVSIETGDIHVEGGILNGPINVSDVNATSGAGGFNASILGNGEGSNNSIFSNLQNNTNVFLNFSAMINNNVDWDLNTGGNTANGNSGDVEIVTGDIFFDFLIKSGPINIGGVTIDCCDLFDPGDDGDGPDGPGNGEPSDGDENGDGEGGDDGGDGGGGDDGGVGGPEILGLSDTSSKGAQTLFFWAGLLMIATGAYLLRKEASGKIAPRRK